MPSEIICNTTGREIRVALMDNGRLAELQIDRGDNRGYVGNVYLGRVVRVLPGMQAAFVDIGLERAAFLYVGDIYQDVLDLSRRDGEQVSEIVERDEESPRSSPRAGQPAIQDLLQEGQQIVVQVAKDPIGTKGARLTTHIALPGRYLVFMPTVEHVGISRRIERDKERRRLREFVERNREKGAGYIVRTVCEDQPTEALKADMDFLQKTWNRVQEAAKQNKAPSLLHADFGLVLRALRDLFDESVERMVVDDKEVYDEVRSFMSDFTPSLQERVHLYRGQDPIFDTYGVEVEISRSLGRKVWLKSGGYLVIDQTEALMAIDVNSGKFVGSSSLEETTLMTNLEAVDEVVHQLRLRNMGGIIIIDFIDMSEAEHRGQVMRALERSLERDRAKSHICEVSALGLVEMTRKRTRESLEHVLCETCPTCSGRGSVRTAETVCYEIFRELLREARQFDAQQFLVLASPEVVDIMLDEESTSVGELEEFIGRPIRFQVESLYTQEQFDVVLL